MVIMPRHLLLNTFLYLITSSLLLTLATALSGDVVSSATALVVEVRPPWDTIDPGVAECVLTALNEAESANRVLIISLDTYGGWLDSALTIGDAIYNAKVPVIGYVSGGKALSAGTLILLPTHVIALSPNSIIGAAQPVTYDPLTGSVKFINESKVLNPIIQKATSYARIRGRNESIARLFIESNLVLDADEALNAGVADLIALNINELISKLSGRVVNTSGGTYIIKVSSYELYDCSLRSRLLSILTNSLINSILLTVGVMAMIFSIASANLHAVPLALLFIVLGLVGSGFNPNLASLLMILIGAVLLALEVFVIPGFGITGVSGIVFIILGTLLIPSLIPSATSPPPQYLALLRSAVISVGVIGGFLTGFITFKILKVRKVRRQLFTMEGKVGRAIDRLEPGRYGYVIIEGEYWLAKSEEIIEPGEQVHVIKVEGHVLVVRKHGA